MKLDALPKTVVSFGLASFFADIASEAVYSLLPFYATSVLDAPVVFNPLRN